VKPLVAIKAKHYSDPAVDPAMSVITHHACPQTTVVVEAPRVTDAIGLALRGVYRRDRSLPPDIRLTLDRLDGVAIADVSDRG
jgi:hypothetical protein